MTHYKVKQETNDYHDQLGKLEAQEVRNEERMAELVDNIMGGIDDKNSGYTAAELCELALTEAEDDFTEIVERLAAFDLGGAECISNLPLHAVVQLARVAFDMHRLIEKRLPEYLELPKE